MSEIRMTGELRTDYDCESIGFPAERWGEAVFKIGEEEKGTLKGLKQILKGEIKAR